MIDILAVYSAFGIKNSSEIKKFIANRSQENIPEKEIINWISQSAS